MSAQLVVIAGPDRGMVIPLTEGKPLQIGRGPQPDVALKDLYVSRLHCRVELSGARLVVTDLGSAAGSFVNNQAITSRTIGDGEYLQIGETHLGLRLRAHSRLDEATIAPPMSDEPNDRLAATRMLRPAATNPELPLDVTRPATPLKHATVPSLPAERLAELTGETLAQYEVGPLLGRGNSGLVFRAFDVKKKKTIALKVLWSEFTRESAEILRFIRSMRTALPLRHPNLVTVYGAGKKGPYCYIAMKYIEGESLSAMIARVGGSRVEWRVALTFGVHLARALVFAHERKIIHRNLTPQNVMIRTADQTALLSDLFLAKAMEGGLAAHLTRPGEVLGDVRYMAPERLEGMSHVDHRSDLYSLGALIYTLLAGQPPFEGANLPELIVKVHSGGVADVKTFQPAIPDGLNDVVRRLLAKRPEDRYQVTAQALADLDLIQATASASVSLS